MSRRSDERRAKRRAAANQELERLRRRMFPGLELPPAEDSVLRAEFRVANEILDEDGLTAEAVCRVGLNCAAFTNGVVAKKASASSSRACGPGCAWCCVLEVTAWPAEVLQLASWLESRCAAEEIAAQRTQLAEVVAIADAAYGAGSWPRTMCPLLTPERLCSVHDMRPAACAGAESLNAEACRIFAERGEDVADGSFMQVPAVSIPAEVAAYAIMERGGPNVTTAGAKVDFHAALEIALRRTANAAAVAWLAGEDVFAEARQRARRRRESLRAAGLVP